MNQMNPHKELGGLEPNPAAKDVPLQKAPMTRLTEADAQMIYRSFVTNSSPMARQSDLVELHKRIVKLFTTLNEGLGEAQAQKAAEDRRDLIARLDAVETSVNRMEGALRIEFEPVMRQALADVIAAQPRPARRPLRGLSSLTVGLGLGLVLGMLFHTEIRGFAAAAYLATEPLQIRIESILSPNGGISEAPTEVN